MTVPIALGLFAILEVVSLLTMPSVLLRRRGKPVSAASWLIALVTFPGIAPLLWFTLGRTRLERRRQRHISSSRRFSGFRSSAPVQVDTCFDPLIPRRACGTHSFSSHGNRVKLMTEGESAFSELRDALAAAESCIHMLYFAFEDDQTGQGLCEVLTECSRRGVKVRLLVDGLGSQASEKALRERLGKSGVEMAVFLPKRLPAVRLPRLNFVNHRKIVVIDDLIAFTGGMNVGDEYRKHWKDLMVRIDGPAAIALNHVFLEDWFFATEENVETPFPQGNANLSDALGAPAATDITVVSSGPDTEGWIHDAFFAAIMGANRRVWLTTPYLIPTPALKQALRSAAGRGVDVRVVLPRESDVRLASWAARPYYRSLLRDGVRIFEYREMLHGKALVVDERCAVGSVNLDYRSMQLSFEICCFFDSSDLCEQLTGWVDALVKDSHEVTEQTLRTQSKKERLIDSVAHLFGPLL